MSILQFINYAFPFVTIPYVVRILGVDNFGRVSFAAAFISFFSMLVDFGFNFSATREISVNRLDKQRISEIVVTVYSIKICLFIISSVIFLIAVLSIQVLADEKVLLLFSFLSVVGSLFLPQWYFQGIEKMSVVTFITFVSRLLIVILIFLFIKSSQDYKLYALLNSLGNILIGLATFFLLAKRISNLHFSKGELIKATVKESALLFLSNISINLYTTLNTFILGLFATPTIVGYWSAADKIRMAVQNIISPITQGLYPHLSLKFSRSKETALKLLTKYFLPLTVFGFFVSLTLYLFADLIVATVLGNKYEESVLLLKTISFLPFIILLSNFFGIQILLNLGGSKEFTAIIFSAGILNLFLSLVIVPKYFAFGTSLVTVFTEIAVTLLTGYYAYKKLRSANVL